MQMKREKPVLWCNDLIDDLNHRQLTELVNYLALKFTGSRASIRKWREKKKGLTIR